MNIDQLMNVGAISTELQGSSVSQLEQTQEGKNFSAWLVDQAEALNEKALASEVSVSDVANGKVENLHQIIIGMEKAKQSFELAVQVRNKLVEGYQEILRMQV